MDRDSVIQLAEKAGFTVTAGIVQGISENLHRIIALAIAEHNKNKEWVGLTKTEFEEAVDDKEDLEDCWQAIEAKLREKNT